jgi:RimJ/RimL family protein N-acetyltransferase
VGRGLATELSAALTRVGFEIERVHRMEIHCDPANVRSAAVPRKLGYTHEATLAQRLRQDETHWRDTMIWSLFEADFRRSPVAQRSIEAYDPLVRRLL